jgi:hypothetical protein
VTVLRGEGRDASPERASGLKLRAIVGQAITPGRIADPVAIGVVQRGIAEPITALRTRTAVLAVVDGATGTAGAQTAILVGIADRVTATAAVAV